jgi:ribose/xylose/arabinose/galactoside ABC-type transport system permease subunit
MNPLPEMPSNFKHFPKVLQSVEDHFIWVLLIATIAGATAINARFFTAANLSGVLLAASPLGCLVLAESLVLLTGNFDLSIEANMIFVAIVGGLLMVTPETATGQAAAALWGIPWHPAVALAVMLALATTIGLINGLMIVKVRMNNFMVTMATMLILQGLALVVGEARNIFGIPMSFRYVGMARIAGFPVAAVFFVVLFATVHVLLTQTVFGRQLYAVGSNREAARAAGIDDGRVIIVAYMLCGLLSGLAAFVLVGRLGTASPGISDGALFLAVAAAVIGGVSLNGGRGTATGILGGLLLMAVIQNALNLAQIPSNYIKVVSGGTILLAVFADAIRGNWGIGLVRLRPGHFDR